MKQNSDHITPLIEVDGLKKYFPIRERGILRRVTGHVNAVDDVSFAISRGETLGLVGESGCGKTTTGRCLLRALDPTAGRILFYDQPKDTGSNDQDTNAAAAHRGTEKKRLNEGAGDSGDNDGSGTERRAGERGGAVSSGAAEANSSIEPVDMMHLGKDALRRIRRNMQLIFQDPFSSLNPRMTIKEIVGEPLLVHGIASGVDLEHIVADLLRKVGLRPQYMNRYPHAFSGGQRQRIGIARALALNPSFVVCDEAVSALDVSVQAQILNLLQDVQDEFHLTYLFISHDLGVVEHVADRVAVMYVGKIVETADSRDLFFAPKHPYTEALLSAVPRPNPEYRYNRIKLKGEVADPSNPPSGCYFHPRCNYATDRCGIETPPLNEIRPGTGHYAACFYANDLTLRGVKG